MSDATDIWAQPRIYRRVAPRFWQGSATGREIRKRGAEAIVVAMYLMTCQHSNMLGIYHLPMPYMAYDTGLTIEGATKGLRACMEAGFCSFDEASEVVWVHQMALFQVGEALKPTDKRCTGIQREYDGLPDCPFLAPFFERYREAFHLKRPRGGAKAPDVPPEAPSKPLAKPHRSQEQEQEQEQKSPPAPQGAGAGGFEAFWNAYPKKVAEAKARKVFERIAPDAELQARMLAAVAVQAQSEQWKGRLRFVPEPAKWLEDRRWEDVLLDPASGGGDGQGHWTETRRGIEGMGEQLGLGRWDQDAFDHQRPGSETFAAYTTRVKRSAAAAGHVVRLVA